MSAGASQNVGVRFGLPQLRHAQRNVMSSQNIVKSVSDLDCFQNASGIFAAIPEGEIDCLLGLRGVLCPPGDLRVVVCLGERVSIVPLSWLAVVLALHFKGVRGVEIVSEDKFSISNQSALLNTEQPGIIESVNLHIRGIGVCEAVLFSSGLIIGQIYYLDFSLSHVQHDHFSFVEHPKGVERFFVSAFPKNLSRGVDMHQFLIRGVWRADHHNESAVNCRREFENFGQGAQEVEVFYLQAEKH